MTNREDFENKETKKHLYDLTIAITFCNQDAFIAETLSKTLSAFATSQYSWQILVGLDHPTKNSMNILKPFLSEHVKVLEFNSSSKLIPLSRASENRLNLLRNANSEFAIMLDGDDWFVDNVDEAIKILRESPTISGVAHHYFVYNSNKDRTSTLPYPYENKEKIDFVKHTLLNKYLHINTVVFRTKFIFDPKLDLYCNDTQLTFYLLTLGNIFYMQKEVMAYRVGEESIYRSQPNSVKRLTLVLTMEELYENLLSGTYKKYVLTKFFQVVSTLPFKDWGLREQGSIPNCFAYQIRQRKLKITDRLLKIYTSNSPYFLKCIRFMLWRYSIFFLYQKNGQPLIPNLNLYYWKGNNFGDELSKYLVEKIMLTKYPLVNIHWTNINCSNKLMAIGSILTFNALMANHTTVWGSGMLTRGSLAPSRSVGIFPLKDKIRYEIKLFLDWNPGGRTASVT